MNPLTKLKPGHRFVVYAILFALDVIIGGTEIGYKTLDLTFPAWLLVSDAVFKFLTAGGVMTALSHVPSSDDAGSTDEE